MAFPRVEITNSDMRRDGGGHERETDRQRDIIA